MHPETFTNISKIIERDSKSTTYKFALLRGVIDMIQDNSPFISIANGRASFPTGLLMEKWLLYYYPVLESAVPIPQIHGNSKLAFWNEFSKITGYYRSVGGFSAFYNDLRNKGIPPALQSDFMALCHKLFKTITQMPMRYIGRSISNEYYSLFTYERAKSKRLRGDLDSAFLIHNYGKFSIPIEYYEAFRLLGSFITGQDSILYKWAEFSVKASGQNLSLEKVLGEVLKSPVTLREVGESKKLYRELLAQQGNVFCVWSGKKLSSYHIDHMIPFSIWKNNDLWNLLPSATKINNNKFDKIPSPLLINHRQDLILHYWQLLNEKHPQRFRKELLVSLLGDVPFDTWPSTAIARLQESCEFLITKRGYEEWTI